jgi:myosin heavy subunit
MEEAALLQQKTLEKAEENFQNQAEDLKKVQSERDQLREGNERMRQVIEQNDDYLGTLKREVQDEMEMLKKERDQKEKDLLTTIEQQRNQIETLKKERDEKEKENQDWSAKNEQQQNQMQALRKERDEKEKEKQDLLTKNWQQQQQVETLKKERDDTEKERLSLSARSEQQQKEITSLGQTIRSLKAKTPGDNQENCLPSQYHESIVMIVNLRSQMALDVGKGEVRPFAFKLLILITDSLKTTAPKHMRGSITWRMEARSSSLVNFPLLMRILLGLSLRRMMAVSDSLPHVNEKTNSWSKGGSISPTEIQMSMYMLPLVAGGKLVGSLAVEQVTAQAPGCK